MVICHVSIRCVVSQLFLEQPFDRQVLSSDRARWSEEEMCLRPACGAVQISSFANPQLNLHITYGLCLKYLSGGGKIRQNTLRQQRQELEVKGAKLKKKKSLFLESKSR